MIGKTLGGLGELVVMTKGLLDLEIELSNSPNQWRWHAASVIQDIPEGFLCTYGEVARETNRRSDLRVNARNIAWLRAHLYMQTSRDTTIPLHRLAKAGDIHCTEDSVQTTRDARRDRISEGSWQNPQWWTF